MSKRIKRGPGRPAAGPESCRVSLAGRITESEDAALEALRKERGLSRSALMRQAVREYLGLGGDDAT